MVLSASSASGINVTFISYRFFKSLEIVSLVFSPELRDLFSLKIPDILFVSFSRTDSGLFIYHLVVWSNFNLFYN